MRRGMAWVIGFVVLLAACDAGHRGDQAIGSVPGVGPHGGRLLGDDEFAVEVTIFEHGVPPEFRLYPIANGTPVPPGEVEAKVSLTRLGGRVDTFHFAPAGDCLKGMGLVAEPHSFDVTVDATWRGRTHHWTYAQIEGRVTLPDEALIDAGIAVSVAGPRAIAATSELPGEVAVDRDRLAHVVPRVGGVVAEVHANLGDVVQAGQRLAAIDSRELAEAKSEFIEAVHVLELAQATFVREERLWKRRITPEIDYLVARHKLEEGEIRRQVAEQKLVALGVPTDVLERLSAEPVGRVGDRRVRLPFGDLLTRYWVTAPLGGTVIEKHLTVGEAVSPDAAILEIADLTSVWVEIAVPAKVLAAIRTGQPATVRAPALGLEANGIVSHVGSIVGESTRTAYARVVLPNPEGQWRPGLFVTVAVVHAETPVPVAVPESAIQSLRDWSVVFVRYGDQFEARPLTLGRRGGGWVEVVSGVDPGERYASEGSFLLKADVGKSGASHDH